MSHQDPVRSVTSRLWSWALSALGLVIVANVVWALLQPLLPVLLAVGTLVLAISVWNKRRWR